MAPRQTWISATTFLPAKNKQSERIRNDSSPRSGLFRRRSRRRAEFRGYQKDFMGLRIERHRSCASLRRGIFHNTKLIRRVLVNDRQGALTIRTESELSFRIERSCIDARANRQGHHQLSVISIHDNQKFIVAANKQATVLAI